MGLDHLTKLSQKLSNMPYGRKKYGGYRRRTYKRPAYRGQRIQKMINESIKRFDEATIEKKYYVSSQDTTINNNGSVFTMLHNITQGTGDLASRVGDKIKLRGANYRMSLIKSNTGTEVEFYNYIRVVWFFYNTAGGGTPAWGDIFVLPSTSDVINSTYKKDQMAAGTFEIVSDKTYKLTDSDPIQHHTGYVPRVTGRNVQYLGGQMDVIGKNDLFCLVFSDSTGTPHPEFKMTTFITYNDA